VKPTLSLRTLITPICRLDIWTSDIVMRRAKEALATLHHNPVAIDRYESTLPVAKEPSPSETQVDKDEAKAKGKATNKASPRPQTVLPGTALRSVLLNTWMSKESDESSPSRLDGAGFFSDNELIQSWCRRQLVEGREPIDIEGDPHLTLNTSQKRAIAMMLSSNISLVQGVSFCNMENAAHHLQFPDLERSLQAPSVVIATFSGYRLILTY
jgi:hypothetical protein